MKGHCVRFQSNLTLKLLSSLYKKFNQSQGVDLHPKTLTQYFIQDYIRAKRSIDQNNIDLTLEIVEEMLFYGEYYEQIGHWAIGEVLYMLALETGLDPLDELNIYKSLGKGL